MTNYLLLQPEDIIVPAEYHVGNLDKLKKYFDLFNRGLYEHVSPVLVVDRRSNSLDELLSQIRKLQVKEGQFVKIPRLGSGEYTQNGAIEFVSEQFEKLRKVVGNARFYLIDGNHRSLAATLNHEPIFAVEPEDNQDLRRLRQMSEQGLFPEIYREEKTLEELKESFEYHCLNKNLEGVMSVRRKANELCHNHDLPHDMIRRYYWEFGIDLQ